MIPKLFSYLARRFLHAWDQPSQPPHIRYPSRQRAPHKRLDL
jgi:hypothetical protein